VRNLSINLCRIYARYTLYIAFGIIRGFW